MIRLQKYKTHIGIVVLCGLLALCLTACGGGNATQTSSSPQATATPPYQTSVKTTDGMFQVQFSVNPDRLGNNTFVVTPTTISDNKPATNANVRLATTMLDMDMGTDVVNLRSDGKGNYSTQYELTMGGHWEIRINIQTPDNTLHEATVKFATLS